MIPSEEALEDLLSEPTPAVIDLFRRQPGDWMFLGVGGKMGPSLARMARRAADLAGTSRRIYGVSRFHAETSDPNLPQRLAEWGVEPIACDLLDETQVAKLPDARWIVSMTGRKFGATGDEANTWAMNAYLPTIICRRFRSATVIAFSTGNVYGYTSPESGGSREADPLAPIGEYAMSCVGRERMYEYFSRRDQIPMTILRLNYACDLRYGVIVDLARSILEGHPVPLEMGYFNTIWQRDANLMSLLSAEYAESPPTMINLTGPQTLSVRAVCDQLARRLDRPVTFTGTEAPVALLNCAAWAQQQWGPPTWSEDQLLEEVALWIQGGGRYLAKPTHFTSTSGRF